MTVTSIGCSMGKIERSLFPVDLIKEVAIRHFIFRMRCDQSVLQLKLNYGNCLVHLANEVDTFLVVACVGISHLGFEAVAGVVRVGVHGKASQGEEVNVVAIFNSVEVGIP